MFNESNTVENFIRDLLCGKVAASRVKRVSERGIAYTPQWQYVPATQLERKENDVLVEEEVRRALIRLNPEINAQPDLADEVIYKLRAILLSVRGDGLVRANEEFTAWLRGERTMPFGPNNEHTPVYLIDFKHLQNNTYIMTTQLTYRAPEKRFDVVLLVNGFPLVVGETKTPTRPAVSWLDGAFQVHDDYEKNVPAFFVPNVFSFASEGKTYRYGSVQMPPEMWAPWREDISQVAQRRLQELTQIDFSEPGRGGGACAALGMGYERAAQAPPPPKPSHPRPYSKAHPSSTPPPPLLRTNLGRQ